MEVEVCITTDIATGFLQVVCLKLAFTREDTLFQGDASVSAVTWPYLTAADEALRGADEASLAGRADVDAVGARGWLLACESESLSTSIGLSFSPFPFGLGLNQVANALLLRSATC